MTPNREETNPTINLCVMPGTIEKLGEFCEQRFLIKRRVMGKLVDWFVSTDPRVQSSIIGATIKMEREYAAVLRVIADELEKKAR